MIRKLMAAAAAVLTAATLSLVAQAPAQATVLPSSGTYSGTDAHGRHVSLSFGNHNQMSHFTVAHQVFGGAHVSNAMWHETCHNGFCTKGAWVNDSEIHGAWRQGGGHWTTWTVRFNGAPTATHHAGPYNGVDHTGLRIAFGYTASHGVVSFKLDHNLIGNAPVRNGFFDTCHHQVCIKGHWQTSRYVVGSWRFANSSHWTAWEARA